ncbi:MAG: hypothetical protein WB643_03030 [Candidatus Bathyarchaeia archaeon]
MEKVHDAAKLDSMMKEEGPRLVREGTKRGLHMRLLGAIAFQYHCPKYSFLTEKLHRQLSDVDFAGYSSERAAMDKMMREFGYSDQPMISALFGHKRMIWDNASNGLHVDIFFDKLEMNHDIPFTGRLELEEMTIPLADMLLEKMQIVHINEKDIVDTIMLLREHAIGNSAAPETVDGSYLAKILSNEWGFYYTVTTNLKKVEDRMNVYPELTEEDRADVSKKIRELLSILDKQPKTLAWKLRARVGPKTKWYKEVEDVKR